MPNFIGGPEGLKKYLADNIQYPINAQKNEIEGTVHVSFLINKNGEVVDIKIYKGVNVDLNNEALRVIGNMPNWNPGLFDGKPVNVSFSLPIKFSLQ
jgi:protein TonB